MVSHQSLKEQFDELGVDPSDEILDKCIEICSRNGVSDPVEFVEQWMAYSVTKLNGAEPTVAYLCDMESHEYGNRTRMKACVPSPAINRVKHESRIQSHRLEDSGRSSTGGGTGLVIYSNTEMDSTEMDVLESYGCITPKAKKPVSRLHIQTPDRTKAQFSPASYSPIASKKIDLDGPNKSGNVIYTFGSGQLLKQTSWSATDRGNRKALSIAVQCSSKKGTTSDDKGGNAAATATYMTNDCKYMFDSSYDRVLILGDRIYEGGKEICERLAQLRKQELLTQTQTASSSKQEEDQIASDDRETCLIDDIAIHHVDFPSDDVISVMGTIVVDSEGKDRLGIVDFDEMTLRYVTLDFQKMKTWALFPGETVVLEGINPRGNRFEVRRIHYERNLELPQAPAQLDRELNMVIAAAPFTDKEDLLYEKLSDLLAYCSNNCPDVLILAGPFADASNPLFGTIAETFEQYFEKIMNNIMSSVSSTTEVLVVSNYDDIMSMFVYPSFPHKINPFFKNLHFLPDPCVVTINGLTVGITTADIIRDLTESEVGVPFGDKIKRAFNYMFHHKTFYPLNPPHENVPIDLDLLNRFGRLPQVPNMMICPGDLKCYVRDVNGCVCINPGHLSDHASGEGTFARVVIHPPESASTVPFNYVTCQVVKS